MHTFKINGVPSDAPIFPMPIWLKEFYELKDVKHFTFTPTGPGIIPQVETELKRLGATEWFANWSGKITPTMHVSITYV